MQVAHLKSQLGEGAPDSTSSSKDSLQGNTLRLLNRLAGEINDNVEERINLQKALFEVEDVLLCQNLEIANIREFLDQVGMKHMWIMFM